MRDDTPTVYLLAGPLEADRTTYAAALADHGVIRLTGVPDPRQELVDHVRAGRDVVLEDGLSDREDREAYQRLVEDSGGQWCVIHFSTDHTELLRRLATRPSPSILDAAASPPPPPSR
jgi:hypothetical protein